MVTETRIVAVIQARTGSSRLPGKVLRPLGGRPVLGWVVRAAQEAEGVDDVVIATSTAAGDDAVAALGEELGVTVVRGSEDDVLSRFALALEETGADAVVRLTADCPLADPALISSVVSMWRADPSLDYAATILVRTLPRGMDVELASKDALRIADAEAESYHRTHVTSYLYDSKRQFRTMGLVVQPAANDLRVTLDTAEDGEMLDAVVAELGDRAPAWHEVVDLLRTRPDLTRINAGVRQKKMADG
ncbi:spore coat protein [Brachybacterium ginsengisoli]|uniref:Spore coat protein n=1 Tax=Brachybacterium ginsengisoli TaxID=1331682 RepID=A0A291GWD2_9MICO|nr:glycosyltransferase family protein [Brachybacterium ginsengisoli]ATG54404.1 spore coat protein [Brachybacterium ginsengisoli]